MINSKHSFVLTVFVFVLMLATLVFMSNAINNSEDFSNLYSLLLVINAIGLLILIYLIGRNIKRLLEQLKENRPGSRLTLRLVTTFILLAIIPLLIVYWFSTDFIRRGIDNWFDVRIEKALTDSLELSKESLGLRMRELLKTTENMAEDLTESSQSDISISALNLSDLQGEINTTVMNTLDLDTSKLDNLRVRNGAEELVVLSRKGKIIASSSAGTDIVPNIPGKSTLLQLRQGRNYIGLEPIRDAGLFIRAVVKIPNNNLDNKTRMLQALYPISTHINELAENVQAAYAEYQELAYLRKPLQLSFTMTLTLVLLFSIFSAVLAAFHSARKLTSPIQDLAEGTRRISQGDYGKQLTVSSSDDLGFLVKSFNQMSLKIAAAQHELDSQRTYLQAVLGKLSSGVLTFDANLNLKTANASASQILETDLNAYLGGTIDDIPENQIKLFTLFESIKPQLLHHSDDWQEQIVLFGASGRQVLMCRGTALDSSSGEEGHVIVFDDITALIQGQKDAAWSEVARRLAHEIKNPLTPIQLSAERLRHKYLSKMKTKDADTLDRLTNTIIQQVGTMKDMVNTFSDYARPSQIKPEPLNVNPMIEEVSTLYQQLGHKVKLELDLEKNLPLIEADHNRLRQILNNLLKNAIEATEEVATPEIHLQTKTIHTSGRELIEIRIIDNGTGFPEDLISEIFEPYVTTKSSGTGLGLAIVKKIVEEHGGMVLVENNEDQGGRVVIRLPVEIENNNVHSINEAKNKLPRKNAL